MKLRQKFMGVLITIMAGYVLLCLAFFLFQEKLIFHPQPLPENYEFSYPEPFEEVMLNTLDGKKVNALHFKAKEPKGVVLYFHGNAGNLAVWGSVASQFLPHHYDLFIIDYRGFGKSTGSLNEYKLHQDALTCYNYLKKYGYHNILVYGRSIGSGVASRLAREVWPKALILESPFNNMTALASHYVPFLPHRFLLRFKFPVMRHINGIKIPVFIIHGNKDTIIPYHLAAKLKEADADLTFYTIENGGHNDLASFPEFDTVMGKILP